MNFIWWLNSKNFDFKRLTLYFITFKTKYKQLRSPVTLNPKRLITFLNTKIRFKRVSCYLSFLPSFTQYLKHLLNVLTYFECNTYSHTVIHKTKWPMSTLNDSYMQMSDTAQYNPHEAFIQIKVLSINISETICKVNILRN